MKLLKFFAVFGLLSVQRSGHLHIVADCTGCHSPARPRRTDQVQVTSTLVYPVRSTLRISGLLNVTRRAESLPRLRASLLARPAECKPIPHTIEFAVADNPSVFQIVPPCTRVNRCSGCCYNKFLSCQVKRVVLRELWVEVRIFKKPEEEVILTKVIVEEHTDCECQCTPKQQCAPKADYNPDICRCWCRDEREADACKEQSRIKVWDADNCSCNCREIEICSEGLVFDYLNCVCKLKDRNTRSHG